MHPANLQMHPGQSKMLGSGERSPLGREPKCVDAAGFFPVPGG